MPRGVGRGRTRITCANRSPVNARSPGPPRPAGKGAEGQGPRRIQGPRPRRPAEARRQRSRAHAHRQGDGARRPLLAPRGRALDRRRPRQRQRRGPEDAGVRGRPERPQSWSTASRSPSPSRRGSGATTSRRGSSPRTATRRGVRRCSTTCRRDCRASSRSGRLDFNTEGLLLLTNDGALARHLELPATGWLRRYRVRGARARDAGRSRPPEGGHRDRGRALRADRGRPRQRRKAPTCGSPSASAKARTARCAACSATLGLEVNRLIRISFGPFQLLDLEPGEADVRGAARARRPAGPGARRRVGTRRAAGGAGRAVHHLDHRQREPRK